jgi:hypothetical protein
MLLFHCQINQKGFTMKSFIFSIALVVVGLFVFSGCAQKTVAPTPTCIVVEADPCCVPCTPVCN